MTNVKYDRHVRSSNIREVLVKGERIVLAATVVHMLMVAHNAWGP
mgnify:FL=1